MRSVRAGGCRRSRRARCKNMATPHSSKCCARRCDMSGLRIDHVLGLRRLWLVPEGADPIEGAYLRYPLDDLLRLIALESHRHRAVIIGEDLGTVPDGFRDDLHAAGVLGMRVLWFERDHGLYVDPSRWPREAIDRK